MLERIAAYVREASGAGRMLRPAEEALGFLADHPEYEWSAEEVAAEMTKHAAARGIMVEH
jgi:hypothetical protein